MDTLKTSITQYKFSDEDNLYVDSTSSLVSYLDGSENELEEIFRKTEDLSTYSQELIQHISDRTLKYNLSYRRINFLSALSSLFNMEGTVLEIGSGSGTITRWFGENFAAVDAFEGNLTRARVTRLRCKDQENVAVYCGDVTKTRFDKKYNVISLIGVLEYLPLYNTGSKDPKQKCVDVLSNLLNNLDENGLLIIAIENKFGTKYFSGCKEDHTSREFDGIVGYPEQSAVTYSRNELKEILQNSGYSNIQFYHAFPDYKYTETLFTETDELLKLYPYNWIRTPFEDNWGERQYLFPEQLFLKEITDAHLLWHFSNSFIVLASKSKNTNLCADWLIKKFHNFENYSSNLHHDISLYKSVNDSSTTEGYYVSRTPINGGKVENNFQDFNVILERNPYILGELLLLPVYRALLSESQESALQEILIKMKDEILKKYGTHECDTAGYPLVKGDAIEYLFSNIVVTPSGEYVPIDPKWKGTSCSISIDLILFRNLYHIFYFITPFLKNKNKSGFIFSLMKSIFPDYTKTRLMDNLKREEHIHNLSLSETVHLTMKSPKLFSFFDISDCAKICDEKEEIPLIVQIRGNKAQITALTKLLQESEADRSARLDQINQLTKLLQESEADRSARLDQINQLTKLLNDEKNK